MTGPARASLPPEHFERLYHAHPDPWAFETSPYEAAKYATTLAALPRSRYRSGLEIGCSIGVFTAQLAARCDALLALDMAATALDRARARCQAIDWVAFRQARLPGEFPAGLRDLIVLSEVGYYLTRDDLVVLHDQMATHLEPGGHALLVHWTLPVEDNPLTGDEVHDIVIQRSAGRFRHVIGQRAEAYRLDLFERLAAGAV